MTIEEYKKKVEDFLIKEHHYTIKEAKELIALYDDEFPEFLKDDWSISAACTLMIWHF